MLQKHADLLYLIVFYQSRFDFNLYRTPHVLEVLKKNFATFFMKCLLLFDLHRNLT